MAVFGDPHLGCQHTSREQDTACFSSLLGIDVEESQSLQNLSESVCQCLPQAAEGRPHIDKPARHGGRGSACEDDVRCRLLCGSLGCSDKCG